MDIGEPWDKIIDFSPAATEIRTMNNLNFFP